MKVHFACLPYRSLPILILIAAGLLTSGPAVVASETPVSSSFLDLHSQFTDPRWQQIRWKMRPEDVAAIFADRIKPLLPPQKFPAMTAPLALPKTSIFGQNFVAYFFFDDRERKLAQIILRRDRLKITPKAFHAFSREVSRLLGAQPAECRPPIAAALSDENVHSWSSRDGVAVLRYQDFYHPGIKFQKDRVQVDNLALGRERRLVNTRNLPRRITLRYGPNAPVSAASCGFTAPPVPGYKPSQ